MNKIIKVIDLLNKIANGEEVPKTIKYNNIIYDFNKDVCDYNVDDLYLFDNTDRLNDTVEIIEEQQDIDIQEIEELDKIIDYAELNTYSIIDNNREKINELIQAVKQLDNKIKDKE